MWRACAVALLCAALAHTRDHKRAEMSASPFVLSSRYGRSSPRMSPRNDRFFLTGRYGKRAAREPPLSQLLPAGSEGDAQWSSAALDRDARRCRCAPYASPSAFRSYYKRIAEVAAGSPARR